MKKAFFVCIFIVLSFSGFTQTRYVGSMEGAISPIEMVIGNITNSGNVTDSYYFYSKFKTPINLAATIRGGSLVLLENTGSRLIEFEFRNFDPNSSVLQGVWYYLDTPNARGSVILVKDFNPLPPPVVKNYEIGDIGPAGGFIFFKKNEYSDGWRYLEAAPQDAEKNVIWGFVGTSVAGTGTAVGTGKQNTELIIASTNQRGWAAHVCAEYTRNGFSDWFLPSSDELYLMYNNLYRNGGLGNFSRSYYWSSSENNNESAITRVFASTGGFNGDRTDFNKNTTRLVRPIRRF